MIYTIKVSRNAERVVAKWKKSNPELFKKFVKIIHDVADHPRTGLGRPEALVGGGDVTYSRRIDARNRMIYDIHDETVTVLVLELEGHYSDK